MVYGMGYNSLYIWLHAGLPFVARFRFLSSALHCPALPCPSLRHLFLHLNTPSLGQILKQLISLSELQLLLSSPLSSVYAYMDNTPLPAFETIVQFSIIALETIWQY